MKSTFRYSVPSALVGAVAAAAVLLLVGTGRHDRTTTVVQQTPLNRPASTAGPRGLTAREIYKRDAPGVVSVRAQIVQRIQSPFDIFPEEQRGEASGSGFVLNKDGYILTNAHVIQGASQVTVQFEDHKSVAAKVVGKDTSTDTALLKVDSGGLSLKPLQLGDSSTVQVG